MRQFYELLVYTCMVRRAVMALTLAISPFLCIEYVLALGKTCAIIVLCVR
jgi:hypothetical protein